MGALAIFSSFPFAQPLVRNAQRPQECEWTALKVEEGAMHVQASRRRHDLHTFSLTIQVHDVQVVRLCLPAISRKESTGKEHVPMLPLESDA